MWQAATFNRGCSLLGLVGTTDAQHTMRNTCVSDCRLWQRRMLSARCCSSSARQSSTHKPASWQVWGQGPTPTVISHPASPSWAVFHPGRSEYVCHQRWRLPDIKEDSG